MTVTVLGDFGPLVLATDLDSAVIDTLKRWFPTYLKAFEIERNLTVGSLPRPAAANYRNTLTTAEYLDNELPLIAVTTAATQGEPLVAADRGYEATWRINISCVVRGRVPGETRLNAARYEGCVRRILAGQRPVGTSKTRWRGTPAIAPAPGAGDGRYLAVSSCLFDVWVHRAVQGGRIGPTVPDADTYLPVATIDSVTTDVVALTGGGIA